MPTPPIVSCGFPFRLGLLLLKKIAGSRSILCLVVVVEVTDLKGELRAICVLKREKRRRRRKVGGPRLLASFLLCPSQLNRTKPSPDLVAAPLLAVGTD